MSALRIQGTVMGVAAAVACPLIVAAASVEIMAAKDSPFCEKVARLLGERLATSIDLLKTVEWSPVELKGQGPKVRQCSSLEKTLLDVDNDGQQELVVRTTFCMKGAPSDSLYVFPEDSAVLERMTWQDLSPLLATPDKFERTGGTYPLAALSVEKEAPPALTTLFSIQPFILDGATYVGLTDARREWMVIARYLRGDRFEDRCYLRWTGR
jgi:hypothetical protein